MSYYPGLVFGVLVSLMSHTGDETERKTVESIEWVNVEAIDDLVPASTVDFRKYVKMASRDVSARSII